MAYTYDDFVTAATGAGLMDQFGEEDLKIAQRSPEYGLSMLKLTQDLKNATTAEQQLLATEALKQLKTTYGSFGTLETNPGTSEGGYSYGNQNEYQKLLQEVANQPSFSYDPSQDPTYASTKKSYLREGERAREDTLAKASAATGGTPSSYAVTAAQQAGDYYSTKFADTVPTLEQNAYQKYLNDFNLKLSQLAAMEGDRSFDYAEFLRQQEADLQKKQAAAELMASAGDYSLLAELYGLTDEQLALLQGTGSGGSGTRSKQRHTQETGYEWGEGITNPNEWGMIKSNIEAFLKNGNFEKAQTWMDGASEKLSEAQYNELLNMFTVYGW